MYVRLTPPTEMLLSLSPAFRPPDGQVSEPASLLLVDASPLLVDASLLLFDASLLLVDASLLPGEASILPIRASLLLPSLKGPPFDEASLLLPLASDRVPASP